MINFPSNCKNKVNISATTTPIQIPFNPSKIGSSIIHPIWNNKVRRNAIIPETTPLFKAVKNEEAQILNPLIKNTNAYNRNPCNVIANRSASYPTKILISGWAKTQRSKSDKPQLQQLKTNSSSTYSSIPNDFQPHNYNW